MYTGIPKYYAEFSTDQIVRERYFPNFDHRGLMIEVGGATPDFMSMSKHFRENGWRTIVVEPNPQFAKLQRNSGNEVFQCACGPTAKSNVPFQVVSQNVEAYGGVVTDHAFSSLELKPEFLQLLPVDAKIHRINVQVRRLDEILDELNVKAVDLLSIDVEGWEIEVMQGIDLNRFEINVILLENLFHSEAYLEYMLKFGYRCDGRVEYNYIFLRDGYSSSIPLTAINPS